VLSQIEGPIGGHAVAGDEGNVRNHERPAPAASPAQHRQSFEQAYGLADLAPGGGHRDIEVDSQGCEGPVFIQMDQHEAVTYVLTMKSLSGYPDHILTQTLPSKPRIQHLSASFRL